MQFLFIIFWRFSHMVIFSYFFILKKSITFAASYVSPAVLISMIFKNNYLNAIKISDFVFC